jgi:glycosyltransferase involved in cell wall biosynthesis
LKDKPLFSVVVVGRTEAKTLPRLLKSLGEFRSRGGDVVYVDTGSKDNTAQVARDAGCRVFEEGDRFRYVVDEDKAKAINDKFTVGEEGPIIKAGDSFFAFDKARNYAMGLASNDFICTPDCDEAWTTMNSLSRGTRNLWLTSCSPTTLTGHPPWRFVRTPGSMTGGRLSGKG